MSFHILHVFKHGAILGKDRGFITMKVEKEEEQRRPHEDIRAVIIAARGVTLTSNFVSAILETDGIILHCNERYQPCGVTAPLQRIIDNRAYLTQASRPAKLNSRLWHHLVRGKTLNQQKVLKKRKLHSAHLELALKQDTFDEGNCARRYW